MRLAALLILLAATSAARAADSPTRLTLKEHRFTPDQIVVPAGQRFRLEIVNADATAEEFESSSLKVERDIAPHGKLILQLGPLPPGDYPFVGDLHGDTARGVLRVATPADAQ
jgi:hypothetical protein